MRHLCLIALVLFSFAAFAAGADRVVPDYPAQQVAARTWVIHGPGGLPGADNKGFMNNPSFTITRGGVIVVDPGSSRYVGQMVLRQIRKVTAKPVTHVLNTHVHGDHWLGNQAIADAFPQAQFHAHPKMIELANAGEADSWLQLMAELTGGASDGTSAHIPTLPLRDGQELVVDDVRLRIYASNHAHTLTDIMIEVVPDKLMILGDNVVNRRIARMDDGSFRGNIKACKRVKQSGAEILVPGHGATGNAASVLVYCEYLTRLYREVGLLAEEGLADFEMKAVLLAKFAKYAAWDGFDAGFGRHISLAMLEYEKASFE